MGQYSRQKREYIVWGKLGTDIYSLHLHSALMLLKTQLDSNVFKGMNFLICGEYYFAAKMFLIVVVPRSDPLSDVPVLVSVVVVMVVPALVVVAAAAAAASVVMVVGVMLLLRLGVRADDQLRSVPVADAACGVPRRGGWRRRSGRGGGGWRGGPEGRGRRPSARGSRQRGRGGGGARVHQGIFPARRRRRRVVEGGGGRGGGGFGGLFAIVLLSMRRRRRSGEWERGRTFGFCAV